MVSGSGVPPYDFLNLYGIPTAGFAYVSPEKRLELKGLKGRTKAEKLGQQLPELLSLRPPLKAL